MKTILLFLFVFTCLNITVCQQANSVIQKQKSFGGTLDDDGRAGIQTKDGGYIFTGGSSSNDGDVSGHHGSSNKSDVWTFKTDKFGNIQWQKSLGGSGNDYSYSVCETVDGNYVVGGLTSSNDGDVSGNKGSEDFWIVKLNTSGQILWQKCLGGSSYDEGYHVSATSDSGFIMAGFTLSNDGDVSGNHGNADGWIVKLDKNGNIQWQRCVGGSGEDYMYDVEQTKDGGYIACGICSSNDGDVKGNHGGFDSWVVKLTKTGDLQWQHSLGGSNDDFATKIKQTTDNGYILAASTSSNNGDVTNNKGSSDYWLVKLTVQGNIQWQKTYGGSGYDNAYDVQQRKDGSYIIAGSVTSNDGDVKVNHGGSDCWIIKTDAQGNLQQQTSLGGSGYEEPFSIEPASDGSYIITSYSTSNNGDITNHHGSTEYEDIWIVKLKPGLQQNTFANIIPSAGNEKILITPNPSSDGRFTIKLDNEKKNITIKVTNNFGKEIYSGKLASANQCIVQLTNQPKGIYHLFVQYNGGMQQAELLMQ